MRAEIYALIVLALIALVSFLGIVSEINKKYGVAVPAFGGALREGIVGNPRFINPLLAQTDADRDATSLVYSGLFRYNQDGVPILALAENYEAAEDGLTYTVKLKENLRWSDGKKLTADDVVFTIALAKNPLVGSPRRANWEGVEIEQIDERAVKFHLKKAYVPFVENLTLGILPRHRWEEVPPSQIAFAELNADPVGAGPYKIKDIKRNSLGSIVSIKLKANKYFVLGKPHIKSILLNFYLDEEKALKDLQQRRIDSLGSVSAKNVKKFLTNKIAVKSIKLQRVIAVFLNQSAQKSLASQDVRMALNFAADKKTIVDRTLGGYGSVIDGPLPPGVIPQPVENVFDPELARSILEKTKKEVSFTLTTAKTSELLEIAETLKDTWNKAGFKVEIKSFPVSDLEQSVIGPRRYDAFLYGEEVIGKSPDPFAFWHSSQRAHPGFNIALYANSKVDKLLEEVRGVADAAKQQNIYSAIHREIKKDLPAIFLFSPHYIYLTPEDLDGMNVTNINTGSDRFSTVHEWYLKRNHVWKIFLK